MASKGELLGKSLAKLFGKSGDDILEEVAQQAAKSGDDVSEAAVIANLQREAADAVPPVGSGKNLEALQRAGDDAAILDRTAELQKGSLNAPYVDAERNINAEKLGLSYDGTAQSKYPSAAGSVKSDLPSYSSPNGLPLNKNIKLGTQAFSPNSGIIASKSAPELFQHGLSPAMEKEIYGDMLRGSDKQKSDALMKWAKENPKKAFAAAGALGGAGYLQLKSDNGPSVNHDPNKPMVFPKAESKPITPEMINRMSPELRGIAVAKSIEQQQSSAPSKVSVSPDDLSKIAPVENTEAPTEEQEVDYSSLMREAQQSSNQNDFYNHLLRAGNQAGAAIASLGAGSQVKADYSGVDALEKTAGKPVSDIKGLMETKGTEQKLKAAQAELSDDAKLRDPNSEVSKLTSDLAIKLGLIKPGTQMTASTLKGMGVNLGTLLTTMEAGKTRAANAALAREARISDIERQGAFRANESELKREEDRQKTMREIETRRKMLVSNLNEWKRVVGEVGTGELMGDTDKYLKALQTEIATDMAKLADPTSSAMSGEVEKYRASLPEIGTIVFQRGKTATDLIDKAINKVNERVNEAYSVRGLNPSDIVPNRKSEQSQQNQQGLTTPVGYTDAQERAIQHVMSGNDVDRSTAINALKKAEKL
jgi:hypothetical protein